MAEKQDEHPLRWSDVLNRAGVDANVSDAHVFVVCDECGTRQALAEAPLEPAEDPNDITAYRCRNGCGIVAVTGFPSPVAVPGSGRHRLGDYIVQARASSGTQYLK